MDRGLIIGENKAARAVLETLRGPNHQPTLSEVRQMPSGRWKCLDCEMLRKREQRAALRGGAPCGGRGRPGVPRREVSQTTTRNRAPAP